MPNADPSPAPAAPPPRAALERIERAGAPALDTDELLAVLGAPVDPVILETLGGLRALLDDPNAPANATLLDASTRARLAAIGQLHQRWLEEPLRHGDVMRTASDTKRYVLTRLRGCRNETFLVLFLSTAHRLIASEALFEGTVDAARVHMRVLVERALRHNASAIIVAHNHISGNPSPSNTDITLTRTLAKTLALFDIVLLDHIIAGDQRACSLLQEGHL